MGTARKQGEDHAALKSNAREQLLLYCAERLFMNAVEAAAAFRCALERRAQRNDKRAGRADTEEANRGAAGARGDRSEIFLVQHVDHNDECGRPLL